MVSLPCRRYNSNCWDESSRRVGNEVRRRKDDHFDFVNAVIMSSFDDVELTDATIIRMAVNRTYKRP